MKAVVAYVFWHRPRADGVPPELDPLVMSGARSNPRRRVDPNGRPAPKQR
jgi:hypothetical protein